LVHISRIGRVPNAEGRCHPQHFEMGGRTDNEPALAANKIAKGGCVKLRPGERYQVEEVDDQAFPMAARFACGPEKRS
jgi:hypothetical protein